MHAIFADLRFALRQLRRSPGFALTVVLTLALGVGTNAVVFSVLTALILKSLPVPKAEQIVFLNRVNIRELSSSSSNRSYPDYKDIRDQNRSFSGTVAYRLDRVGASPGGAHPEIKSSWFITASENYFDVLGVQPMLGRYFHASDARGPGSAPYVVLSYSFWQSFAHGDRSVVGHILNLNKQPFTVIGVAPQHFNGAELMFTPDFWVPLSEYTVTHGDDNDLKIRGSRGMWVLGRLRDGVSKAQAGADMRGIASRLGAQYKEDEGSTIRLSRPGLIGETFGSPARAFLFGVTLLAGLVLVAACANLGPAKGSTSPQPLQSMCLVTPLTVFAGSPRPPIPLSNGLQDGRPLGCISKLNLLTYVGSWNRIVSCPVMPGAVPRREVVSRSARSRIYPEANAGRGL